MSATGQVQPSAQAGGPPAPGQAQGPQLPREKLASGALGPLGPDATAAAGATAAAAATELQAVADRYARRIAGRTTGASAASGTQANALQADRYHPLRPEVWRSLHERQAALFSLFAEVGLTDLSRLHLTEVGCGAGGNLLELLRLGFMPHHLTGIELLAPRWQQARAVLPEATRLLLGDASVAPIAADSQHLVMQSTVFSSLLDDNFQQQLAQAMWRWLKPGGAVLWYDFTINNPRNPDVRGVPLHRVQHLFPAARVLTRRVTLAPPLARALCAVHPGLYPLFNCLPLLRTHLLAWIEKPLA